MSAQGHLPVHRLHDLRMGVTQDQRAVSGPVVDDAVAVHVPLDRAQPVSGVQGEGRHAPGVVGDPVREDVPGPRVSLGRSRVKINVALLDSCDHDAPSHEEGLHLRRPAQLL